MEQLDIGYSGTIKHSLDELGSAVSRSWSNLTAARQRAEKQRRQLQSALSQFSTFDYAIVVFGSLARDEFTSESDLDWTLLVDASADPNQIDAVHAIRKKIAELEGKPPGREGTFGSFAFSHELVHLIGGQDDTNANTTRRILLLLESKPIGRREAYERVVNKILHRYLSEDRGLWYGSGKHKVPRFLLNDIVRYWRTMAVDFAYKQRSRANEGWALRNIKLRMSRKLIFIAGLLACFSCELDLDEEQRRLIFEQHAVPPLVDHLQRVLSATPIELLSRSILRVNDESLYPAAAQLFDSYDQFIGLLADESKGSDGKTPRRHLEELPVDQLDADPLFKQVREISHSFQDAVRQVFLYSPNQLQKLTIEYGVF